MRLHQLVEAKQKDENDDMQKTPPPGDIGDWLTTAQAARILKVTMSRVRQFIMDGRLKSHSPVKGRRDNLLKKSDVLKFKDEDREITGRPPEK